MKKSVKKISSIIAIICILSSVNTVTASAAGSENSTVYQVCVEENQYTENGVYVHEYVWQDPSSNGISVASALDSATWKTSNLDNGTIVKHRAAKEYNELHSVWNAHAETTAYKNESGVYNRTTVRIVNAILSSVFIEEEKSSSWAKGHTKAITTEGALASEPLLALRSYWSTEYPG